MNNDRSLHGLLFIGVVQLKTLRKVEIELDGCTLVRTSQRVSDCDVNLWSVECTSTNILLPLASKVLQRLLKHLLGIVPHLNVSNVGLRSCGEEQLEFESKQSIDVLHEFEASVHFVLDLIGATENVSIILLETTQASHSTERSLQFVSVQNSSLGEAHRQLTVRAFQVLEHETMSRAIHRLQAMNLVVNVELEHIVLVLVPVTGSLPQLIVEHVWSLNLNKPTSFLLILHELQQLIEDMLSLW
mmetsp:Transcript_377/g.1430  ORF Transcript_377/g.1430 Transcript_377/m.1430 type:complete len:244 (-) Transcript_377:1000-1731(-)